MICNNSVREFNQNPVLIFHQKLKKEPKKKNLIILNWLSELLLLLLSLQQNHWCALYMSKRWILLLLHDCIKRKKKTGYIIRLKLNYIHIWWKCVCLPSEKRSKKLKVRLSDTFQFKLREIWAMWMSSQINHIRLK